MKLYLWLFIGCIIVAILVRFIGIGTNPPSLTWDEVAWGYNAYSLGIDGRDEFGRSYPVQYLESFGDFKPPVYAYLDILPTKLLGLNEFSTRLPSAVAGVGSVIMTYFLVLQLFPTSKRKYMYALISAGLLAISPWSVMLSRAAFEANVATFFIITGLWAFFAGISYRRWLLIFAAIMFVIPFYTFNTPRVFLPLMLLFFIIFFWKKLWERKKQTIIAAIVFILLLAPLVPFLLTPQASLRFKEVNIFSDPQIVETSNAEIVNDNNSIIGKLLDNRRVLYAQAFIKHYFDEFNPDFLFFTGDVNPKFSLQSTGELYIWCFPFLILGVLFLFRNKENYWWIIPVWLLLAIIPAATARETPHALRTEVALPTFQILIAYGLTQFIFFVREGSKKYRYILRGLLVLVALIIVFEFVRFVHVDATQYPIEHSEDWQYGYKDTINFVKQTGNTYDRVYVTDLFGRPYIYYLYYLQIDPKDFRANADITRDAFGFVHVDRVEKYYFSSKIQDIAPKNGKTLYIDSSGNIPASSKVLKRFYALNGRPTLVAYTY